MALLESEGSELEINLQGQRISCQSIFGEYGQLLDTV